MLRFHTELDTIKYSNPSKLSYKTENGLRTALPISATARKRRRYEWISIWINLELHPTIRAVPFGASRGYHLWGHTHARQMKPFLLALYLVSMTHLV